MLAEIYGWFTEGFDTADLKDAEALLGGVEPVIGRQRKYALFEMRPEMRTVFPYRAPRQERPPSARRTGCFQFWAVPALLG